MLEILPEIKSLPHDSAHLHVAGSSRFIDDQPLMAGELHVGVVLSPHAKARILNIDFSKALSIEGVECVLKASDLAHNRWGSIICEQPIIADSMVNYVGEVVAVVAAQTVSILKKALKQVFISYEILEPILSIDDAIKKRAFIQEGRKMGRGDAKANLEKSAHQLSGVIKVKGAEHFYLENHAAIAIPEEDGFITVHSSTQHPTETQLLVAEALGCPHSFVTCIAKRLGGGFGGKETQAAPFAVYAALVAKITNKPARLVISKDDDMAITGKRNPYQIHYRVGFDEKARVLALDCELYGDGGAYADLSTSILERAMAHVDNAYFLPHINITGFVCRTNYHSHTAFRGFGGPKGVLLIEHIMEEIGHFLGKDALDVRKINCYQGENNITPYGQTVENNLLPELFLTLEERCGYRKRRKELDQWNADKNNHPRGMSLTAIKFGISFTTRFLNQGHALIHIFRDGSVQVATGAVEMGQGVQVRIKGLLADVLGINPNLIKVLATATDKSANTSPTAASSGTDLNGTAAVIAANKIKAQLSELFKQLIDRPKDEWPQNTAPVASAPEIEVGEKLDESIAFRDNRVFYRDFPDKSMPFMELVDAAYLSRIALSAYGFYKVPNLSFNKLSGQGNAFLYFTEGVACSEVEIDRFTGEAKILRTDILMDMGEPINQAMDKGQISGAFIQGTGWIMSENLFYDEKGRLLSHAPSTYKIPSIHDIPRIFNIDFILNKENQVNLVGTKASGEPPLMLCFSVWNALKNALAYQQGKSDEKTLPNIPIPATAEVLLRHMNPTAFSKEK